MFGESHIFLWTALTTATLLPFLASMLTPSCWYLWTYGFRHLSFPSCLSRQTWPWLCPTPKAHLQLFCCQLAAVSSSGCIPSSFSRVRTSGRYQSLVEAAFPGHQPIWSPQWHAGICWHWAGALGSFLPTAGMCTPRTSVWSSPSLLMTNPPTGVILLLVELYFPSTGMADTTAPSFQEAVVLNNSSFHCNLFYLI